MSASIDPFGALLLGIVSASARLERALAVRSAAPPMSRDDPALLAVLGLVSLAREARRAVTDLTGSASRPSAPVPDRPPALSEIGR